MNFVKLRREQAHYFLFGQAVDIVDVRALNGPLNDPKLESVMYREFDSDCAAKSGMFMRVAAARDSVDLVVASRGPVKREPRASLY